MEFAAAYGSNNESLQRVPEIKDLGTIFDNEFSFAKVSYVINKTKRKLGFIKRSTRVSINPATIVTLFKSMVAPTLTYTSSVTSPIHDLSNHPARTFWNKLFTWLHDVLHLNLVVPCHGSIVIMQHFMNR